jgi:hypothetical protein
VGARSRQIGAGADLTAEPHRPVILYRLNRHHLATESIESLANLRGQLLDKIREHIDAWSIPARGAYLFGSAARGEGTVESDIDVLIVRPDELDAGDPTWIGQLHAFASDVTAWTGNDCRVADFSEREFGELLASPERLAKDLRSDAINLTDRRVPRMPAVPQ